jgi:hypothetical protein
MASAVANPPADSAPSCAAVKPPIYLKSPSGGALQQGEVLCDVTESIGFDGNIVTTTYSYGVIVSQDCDLHQEAFKGARQNLNSPELPRILLCLAQAATSTKTPEMGSDKWKRIAGNQESRYHFFEAVPPEHEAKTVGLPELVVDFKRYFVIPTVHLYDQIARGTASRRCVLATPYKEHFQSRFTSYLGRIGLPEDHRSAK